MHSQLSLSYTTEQKIDEKWTENKPMSTTGVVQSDHLWRQSSGVVIFTGLFWYLTRVSKHSRYRLSLMTLLNINISYLTMVLICICAGGLVNSYSQFRYCAYAFVAVCILIIVRILSLTLVFWLYYIRFIRFRCKHPVVVYNDIADMRHPVG